MNTLTENYNRFFNENLNEAQIPSNIRKFAKERGVLRDVQQIARWAEKAGERIVGGTAIGRGYDTLVLDLTYDGSEIYFDTDEGTIEVNGQPVDSWESFSDAVNESVNEEADEFELTDQELEELKDEKNEVADILISKIEQYRDSGSDLLTGEFLEEFKTFIENVMLSDF